MLLMQCAFVSCVPGTDYYPGRGEAVNPQLVDKGTVMSLVVQINPANALEYWVSA